MPSRLQAIADAAGVDAGWLNRWLHDQIERRRKGGGAGARGSQQTDGNARCHSCGAEMPERAGRGRPRKFCTACVPSGDAAAVAKAWRRVTARSRDVSRTGGDD
jgi:hypothetical protein